MLTITTHEDGSIALSSDDMNAENALVMEAFDESGEMSLFDEWESTPSNDTGLVTMTVSAEQALDALDALEPYFAAEVYQAFGERRKLGL